jgi:hypothetical protein
MDIPSKYDCHIAGMYYALRMSERRAAKGEARSVTRSEFLRDTRAVVQRAEREGPVVITDENGTPRMAIHCPREKKPFSVD